MELQSFCVKDRSSCPKPNPHPAAQEGSYSNLVYKEKMLYVWTLIRRNAWNITGRRSHVSILTNIKYHIWSKTFVGVELSRSASICRITQSHILVTEGLYFILSRSAFQYFIFLTPWNNLYLLGETVRLLSASLTWEQVWKDSKTCSLPWGISMPQTQGYSSGSTNPLVPLSALWLRFPADMANISDQRCARVSVWLWDPGCPYKSPVLRVPAEGQLWGLIAFQPSVPAMNPAAPQVPKRKECD